jgi:hypothetical protein
MYYFCPEELPETGESAETSPRKFRPPFRLSAIPCQKDIWSGKRFWKLSTRFSISLVDSTLGHRSRSEIQARNVSYIALDIENLSCRCQPTLNHQFNKTIDPNSIRYKLWPKLFDQLRLFAWSFESSRIENHRKSFRVDELFWHMLCYHSILNSRSTQALTAVVLQTALLVRLHHIAASQRPATRRRAARSRILCSQTISSRLLFAVASLMDKRWSAEMSPAVACLSAALVSFGRPRSPRN